MDRPPFATALEALAGSVDRRSLSRRVERLQAGYRGGAAIAPLVRDAAVAYAVYRMPATYAATLAALTALCAGAPAASPTTLLDVGGGSGAAMWAAAEVFPLLTGVTVVERADAMAEIGRSLAAAAPYDAVRDATWVRADVAALDELPPADLVVAAYALGELAPAALESTVDRMAAAAPTVVVVEPGTPRGFATVRQVRERLVGLQRRIAAPCPHDGTCPMAGADWCHLAVRLTRSVTHRQVKGAARGFEDEKFSYVAATSGQVAPATARVLRHPQIRSGHVRLTLCTRDAGLRAETVSKRHGALYRAARGVRWGDSWPPPPLG